MTGELGIKMKDFLQSVLLEALGPLRLFAALNFRALVVYPCFGLIAVCWSSGLELGAVNLSAFSDNVFSRCRGEGFILL